MCSGRDYHAVAALSGAKLVMRGGGPWVREKASAGMKKGRKTQPFFASFVCSLSDWPTSWEGTLRGSFLSVNRESDCGEG